jgi:pimeloyl-ACP methyl ester carboxylesterase
MPYAMNSDVRIHYRVEGEGQPLVLQHGFFWSIEGWYRLGYVDALKSNHRLILIDMRGHGASDKPHDGGAYTLQQHVSDVTAVLDHLNIPSAHFWGFSMGGWIGFGMAKYAAERLWSLIIGGASPFARSLPPESRPDGKDPEAFVSSFFERMNIDRADLSEDAVSEFYNNDFMALSASLQDRPPLEDILPSIVVPCLLYVGDQDGIFEQVKETAVLIPGSQLVTLPGLNHPQSFYEAPRLLSHVTQFLGNVRTS